MALSAQKPSKKIRNEEDENEIQLGKIARAKRREKSRRKAQKYIEDEAGIDSEDEYALEGDEADLSDEGSLAGFINDGSDAGSFRDSLDSHDHDNFHRDLDVRRESSEFMTPVFGKIDKRRADRRAARHEHDDTTISDLTR